MSQRTSIQYCDSSVNPTTGCDGCDLWRPGVIEQCYAGRLTTRFGKHNAGLAEDFNVVNLAPGRMAQAAAWSDLAGRVRKTKPWLNGLPRIIFIGDMADTFSRDVPFEYLREEVIAIVDNCLGRRHSWLWLTKRPGRMVEFSRWLTAQGIDWPWNLWAGTSVTTQATTSRIDELLQVGDVMTKRFVSVEPQWEADNLGDQLPMLDWVIQGGHSGSRDYPFALEWADGLREQCREHKVPYFLKQLGCCATENGERLSVHRGHGGDWTTWPQRLRVRQMPIAPGNNSNAEAISSSLGFDF